MSDLGDAISAARGEPGELGKAVKAATGSHTGTTGLTDSDLARIRAKHKMQQIVNIDDETWAKYSDSQREYFCESVDRQIAAIRQADQTA